MGGTGNNIGKLVVSIFVTFLVYFFLGTILSLISMDIYNNFPSGNFTFTTNSVSVHNNAPLNFPGMTPTIMGLVSVDNSNVTCKLELKKGSEACSLYRVNLGVIPSGESRDLSFKLEPSRQNFSLTTKVYLNYFPFYPAKKKDYFCHYVTYDYYSCLEI